MLTNLIALVSQSRLFDLAQPYYVGMPHYPTHPPFLFGLTKKHGDVVGPDGVSSAADSVALGTHVGTHIDALCHFSLCGKLHDGTEAAEVQSYAGGLGRLTIDTVEPILRRGVLLDIARLQRMDALPLDFAITPQHLGDACDAHGVEVRPGDVVLLRTGWGRFWDDAPRYISDVRGPGPEEAGAGWLSERGIFAAGSDTVAFERVPNPAMPVHVHLLVKNGIHIIEALNLEALAAARVHEFLFIAAPLKIQGATGSPIRPLALA